MWTNFSRTVLADDLRGAIGLDIARDGKVYWTEIGDQALQSQGRLRMYDPQTRATSTLLTLLTRADHQSSNDGVLGMALDPDFATNRQLYIYYSPRQDPGCNSCLIVGHNVISRFTLNAAGTAVVAGSEQEILRVPKVKVGNDNRDGVAGQNTYSAHVGGGSISFDSAGDLYIGTGDDVDPFGEGGNGYAPLDQRYPQRYDSRNTSANTNDLRGKVLRIHPLANAAGAPAPAPRTRSRPGTCSRPARRTRSPRSSRWASATRSRSRPTRRTRARSWSATTAPTRATNSATRGPAGIIEWNRVTKPGFFGWPLCAGDNSAANSYFRYTFPSGPSGTRFDCAAAEIPNESPNNTGLPNIPGPAVGADVWHKRTGEHPARFAIPAQLAPAGVDHRADLPLRRGEPVDDEVAGVLRRRVAHARPQPELVARDARQGRRLRDPARQRPVRLEPVRLAQPHVPDPGQVRARRLAVHGDVGLRLLPRAAAHAASRAG